MDGTEIIVAGVQSPTPTNLLRSLASPVWQPNSPNLDAKIDFYTDHAMSKYSYTQEQALGLLFWHKHNVDKALADLPQYAPAPDDWCTEDRVLFEQAFTFLGKNFNRIHNMLPEKSVGSLVKYYYSWKKRKNNVSSMDRQASKMLHQDFQNSEKNEEIEKSQKQSDYWMCSKWSHARNKSSFDLYLNAEELLMLMNGQGEHMFSLLDNELSASRKKVSNNKVIIAGMKRRSSFAIDKFRIPEVSRTHTTKWTNSELLLAVQGIRQYGTNFQAISEVIGTKSEHLVRNFFMNFKTRYNLDEVMKEYEKEMKLNAESQQRHPLHQQQLPIDQTFPSTNKHQPSLALSNQAYRQTREQGHQQQPSTLLKHFNSKQI
ncbi:hypothetical protein HELRODRAFT_171364 [Helobdella robusta]|uniref:REST corepressor 3 n=1 Tax=Helobdella robusta TaxID=6412 RepID=T1F465_HELRO|nr:hypothetical protein HELRODRAFT_171364 [Helobdella robusta]ESO05703.1 hypothetical protein HELRODRAFT_171364 [Helobdella robusta]